MVDRLAQAGSVWLVSIGRHPLALQYLFRPIRIDFSWTAYCESQLAQVFLPTK